jgi:toxin ParE1/3/4
MPSFRLSQRARADLTEIHRYIAERNATAAANLLDELFDLFVVLAKNPLLGELRVDLRPSLRSISRGNYVIFFYSMPDGADIAAVIHSARDIEPLLRE